MFRSIAFFEHVNYKMLITRSQFQRQTQTYCELFDNSSARMELISRKLFAKICVYVFENSERIFTINH